MFSNIISTVDEIEKYERVLPISRAGDIVLTKTSPEKSYLQWLRSVGLGQGKVIVVEGPSSETLPERAVKNGLRKKIDSFLGDSKYQATGCPYYGGHLENAACQHLNLQMYAKPDLVRKYDSKINFNFLCREINVPVIDNIMIKSGFNKKTINLSLMLNKVKQLLSITGKVIIKGEFGASGSTTTITSTVTLQSLEKLITEVNTTGLQFIIEPLLTLTSSPSSLWFISREGDIFHIRTSNQLLSKDGSVHAGNEFPWIISSGNSGITFNSIKFIIVLDKIYSERSDKTFTG